ncbi:MAG TPA: hypothetical protein PK546_03065 [Chitinophagales bacterium]|mgnify:FL=1|jgi:signal-transduction protein with cAMP-binding, CBS, and nucleotidyltransferase domain|nr:hypothetical protein [Chitinophagales bacterium]
MANVFYKDYTPNVTFLNTKKPTCEECFDYFIQFLSNFSFFKPKDLVDLDKYWEYCVMQKNEAIVLPGEICENIVFICKGAVKHFTGGTKSQYIIEFATDCDFSAGVRSFLGKTKAVDGFVCTKRTYGLKISYKNYHSLIRARPAFEQLLNLINDKANQNIRDRLTSFQSMDAKGRYELMLSQYPDVFEKFTMQDISNYMGIKAETLSRLKKEIDK